MRYRSTNSGNGSPLPGGVQPHENVNTFYFYAVFLMSRRHGVPVRGPHSSLLFARAQGRQVNVAKAAGSRGEITAAGEKLQKNYKKIT